MSSDRRPGLGEETVPANEAEQIEEVTRLNRSVLDTKKKPVHRGQHPKGHGCVEAKFIVEDGLPDTVRHGLFATPGPREALIRFSNGGGWDDTKGDAHGMAVKLLDVPGTPIIPDAGGRSNQDFIMVDHPVFFIRNNADYVEFSRAFAAAKNSLLTRMFGFLPPLAKGVFGLQLYIKYLRSHPYEKKILMEFLGKTPLSPLQINYWSTTPYHLGPPEVPRAIRFRAEPVLDGVPPAPQSSSPDRLRQAMSSYLKDREAIFRFFVQVQTDAETMPVEDPTIPWDVKAAPEVQVATIRIPPQSFESKDQMERCENLSFTPWHSLPEHRPLGGINRSRRVVYERLSKVRHELNGVAT